MAVNIGAKNSIVLTTKPAIGPHSHMNEVSACESPRVCTNTGKNSEIRYFVLHCKEKLLVTESDSDK